MGIGPIPFTAIVDYFNLFELSDFEEFSYVIRRMDKVYLEMNNKDLGKDTKGGVKSSVNSNKKNTNKS